MIAVCFYFFSALAVLGSLCVVFKKSPVSSAFSLILVFFSLAGLYALLEAHLVATLQLLVYAGGIMVLFIFVIMLLQADLPSLDLNQTPRQLLFLSGLFVLTLLFLFMIHFERTEFPKSIGPWSPSAVEKAGGNTQILSETLFSEYILPFELTSILLLMAIVGSVAMAKRKPQFKTALKKEVVHD